MRKEGGSQQKLFLTVLFPTKKINMFHHRVRQKSEQHTAKGNDADGTSDATMPILQQVV